MKIETKQQLIKRFKSFLWRLGSYTVISGLALLADNIGLFGWNTALVAIVSYACGEITKYVNTFGATSK